MTEPKLKSPITDFISAKTKAALERAGWVLNDPRLLREVSAVSRSFVLRFPGVGRSALNEIRSWLQANDLDFDTQWVRDEQGHWRIFEDTDTKPQYEPYPFLPVRARTFLLQHVNNSEEQHVELSAKEVSRRIPAYDKMARCYRYNIGKKTLDAINDWLVANKESFPGYTKKKEAAIDKAKARSEAAYVLAQNGWSTNRIAAALSVPIVTAANYIDKTRSRTKLPPPEYTDAVDIIIQPSTRD